MAARTDFLPHVRQHFALRTETLPRFDINGQIGWWRDLAFQTHAIHTQHIGLFGSALRMHSGLRIADFATDGTGKSSTLSNQGRRLLVRHRSLFFLSRIFLSAVRQMAFCPEQTCTTAQKEHREPQGSRRSEFCDAVLKDGRRPIR